MMRPMLRLEREPADTAPSVSAVATLTEAVVVGSGKGGVGKSSLATLLAAEIARQGRRVLLLDGAQNQGNLHILLGVRPSRALDALLRGEAEPEELLVRVAEGLWLLPGTSGSEQVQGLSALDRARLHRRLTGLYDAFDLVVIDAGPGLDAAIRVAAMRATRLVTVAVPEPASLSDAYALLKLVHLQAPTLPIDVLVNRTLSAEEGPATYERLGLAARRFLERDLGYLGSVGEDPAIGRAVRTPGALLAAVFPEVSAAAERLLRAPGATEAAVTSIAAH